ncbi:proton-conducting transporter membrane subunit [Nitrospira moscoviensis]|uniref:Putative NADH-quinone oxidoreductase, subunit M n=1 Tax=Nitrospira moscoviensis TaxID=42253 RepID=A0A0K2GJU2_NITMO|nr:proton-conducting transporter membrane subunit [Nitrospira moscoviensis]ALA61223.1 putative NADH-quinone oxidoreductase, subunit M [Nitrospira moscoviensis]
MTFSAQLWPLAVALTVAAVGLALLRKPDALKVWLVIGAMVSLGTVGWTAGQRPAHAASLPLTALLPLAAFASLLGQAVHRRQCGGWLVSFLGLGLSLGVLTAEPALAAFCLVAVLAVVAAALLLAPSREPSSGLWGIGTLGLGALMAAGSLMTGPPVSSLAWALACATALPLVPLHKGFVAALTILPANLPGFLAVALPVIGFHGLLTVLPLVPPAIADALGALALAGVAYGSLRAFTQSRAASVVSYGGAAFYCILWWYLCSTRTAPAHTVVYLSAVGLATGGLLLAWHQLRARYGEIDLRALSGLARPMPRFAVVLSLLALAAIGLPPFGVYAGMLGMLLAPSFTWSSALPIILLGWLAAAWYLFALVQRLLFGAHRPEYRHEDLRGPEWASLALFVVFLIALGIMPDRWFDPGATPLTRTVVMGAPSWSR